MDRREAISKVGLLLGGSIIGAELFISGCVSTTHKVDELFTKENIAYMDEIADTILPSTKTPGAKAANVGGFMAMMVRDCYTPDDQQIFIDGLAKLNDVAEMKVGKKFMACNHEQRTQTLIDLDKEQKHYTKTKRENDSTHYFRMIKELTLLGYFTSEIGCTQAMRFLPVPGKYDGNMPYKKGDKAWAQG